MRSIPIRKTRASPALRQREGQGREAPGYVSAPRQDSKRGRHFILLGKTDTTSIISELDAAPEMWLVDTSRQRKVRCQRHTQNIYLRAARKPLPPGAKNANDVHESRVLRSAARFPQTLELCESIARQQGARLGRAALVTLLPQSRVYPHIDHGAYYRVRDRYHIVVKSAQGSPLKAGDETVVMRESELWVFNNKVRHSARNSSSEPRIHLIFDLLPAEGRRYFSFPPESPREIV